MSINRQRGLTLIELVIFMVIVGVAAAGVMGVLNIGSRNSADPARRKQALMIAEAFMEEVQMARFTFCDPNDANAATATAVANCSTPITIGIPAGARPYGNVANYAGQAGVASRTFASGGIDRDINGRAMGQDASLATMGNSSLAPYVTTVTLNYVPCGAGALGPQAACPAASTRMLTSTANNLQVLKITVVTSFGNDSIQLDGYRTRYAPTYLP